ncbi:hypothetical protein Y023_2479 [Burkholderia pseudomallei A79D]|nr:hypothetical protein Y023_2479 [Burkholderia pseudomallei A79D]
MRLLSQNILNGFVRCCDLTTLAEMSDSGPPVRRVGTHRSPPGAAARARLHKRLNIIKTMACRDAPKTGKARRLGQNASLEIFDPTRRNPSEMSFSDNDLQNTF